MHTDPLFFLVQILNSSPTQPRTVGRQITANPAAAKFFEEFYQGFSEILGVFSQRKRPGIFEKFRRLTVKERLA